MYITKENIKEHDTIINLNIILILKIKQNINNWSFQIWKMAAILSNKYKLNPIVTELFIRVRKLNISLAFTDGTLSM